MICTNHQNCSSLALKQWIHKIRTPTNGHIMGIEMGMDQNIYIICVYIYICHIIWDRTRHNYHICEEPGFVDNLGCHRVTAEHQKSFGWSAHRSTWSEWPWRIAVWMSMVQYLKSKHCYSRIGMCQDVLDELWPQMDGYPTTLERNMISVVCVFIVYI